MRITNMAQRRSGNSHTTISVTWEDKDEFRRYADIVKETKHGNMYESDAVVFSKILEFYKKDHTLVRNETDTPTYPNRISLGDVQPDSNLEEPIEQ